MPRNVYSEINLHITWHVKANVPVLKDAVEMQLRRHLRGQVLASPGVYWHDCGGTDNHVHLVVTVPPSLLVSDWIGVLKGRSSHYINHEIVNRKLLHWQDGYGVVSFGSKDLPWVLDYVRRQREHHASGQIHERLERIEHDEEESPLKRAEKEE